MVRIVGVHGVANWLPELTPPAASERLSGVWAKALRESAGDLPFDVRVAYYADLLHDEVGQGDAGIETLSEEAAGMVLSWARTLGLPEEEAQGRATAPIRHVVAWVARRYGLESGLVSWFIGEFFGEVSTYLASAGAACRSASRRRISDLLDEHRPSIVIAHSLGSVVTYETLCRRDDLDIDLFLTLGSPLALPDVVYERLDAGDRKRPACVRRWINIADRGDFIAVPPKLGGRFAVDADHETSIGTFEFHRARKYLESPLTGIAVAAVPAPGRENR